MYRPNALSGDPNHLGIMLIVPLLVLTPIYLRLGAGHRLRTRLGALLAFLLVVEIATLSRSGLLGLAVGGARARAPVPPLPPLAAPLRAAPGRARRPRRRS